MGPRRRLPPEVAHAARVALAASLLVGIVYAACVAVLDQVVSARLTQSVDARLAERLSDVQEVGLQASYSDDDDLDSSPVYLWRLRSGQPVAEPRSGSPALPRGFRLAIGRSTTLQLSEGPLRVTAATVNGLTFLAGQSLQSEDHLTALLREGETLVAPVLLLAMFGGALTIGLRALSPVEQSRRRQLEFTADASHELRTPLSVISAETSIALSAPRKPAEYRAALARIESESGRLRKIVEDLLWLARFDSRPPQPGDEPLDLATIAAACAERFRALAVTHDFDIQVVTGGPGPDWISAPPEWIDRLAGVLIDNACRYAGPSGIVRVSVGQRGNRVTMTVEDSGPGVAAEYRSRLFDRFHRSTEQGGSAGLGLAIADSIVRSTEGQWRLGDSALGGALFEVSWRRAGSRQAAPGHVAGAASAAAGQLAGDGGPEAAAGGSGTATSQLAGDGGAGAAAGEPGAAARAAAAGGAGAAAGAGAPDGSGGAGGSSQVTAT
jgi:signal transduction histidine kinase